MQDDEVYVRVGASEKRLQQEADRIDYDLQLDEQRCPALRSPAARLTRGMVRCLEAGKVLEIKLAEATAAEGVDIDDKVWYNLYGKYDQLDPEHIYRQELYKR